MTSITLPASAADHARSLAARFLNLLTQARFEAALQDGPAARRHIDDARKVASRLTALTSAPKREARDAVALYNVPSRFYFQPVRTGPVAVIAVGAPVWSGKNGVAVKEAETVYVTFDRNGVEVEKSLDEADHRLDRAEYDDAENSLAKLTKRLIAVEDSQKALAIKANDNLDLTRHYLAQRDYSAATVPLDHAREALDAMAHDARYAAQKVRISGQLAEVERLRRLLSAKNAVGIEAMRQGRNAFWAERKGRRRAG